MNRKTVLFIAMSLDGYIADVNGQVDWLSGEDVHQDDHQSYTSFIQNVDTIIMGWKTYHQLISELSPNEWVYQGMKTYVFTHHQEQSLDDIIFINQGIEELLMSLKQEEGKDIWICGGANIVRQLLEKDCIDRFHISIIPTLLGDGIRLFEKNHQELKLKLIKTESYNGITDLIYERR